MGGQEGTLPFDFDGTSTLALNGLQDYRMVNDLSTKDYIVVKRGQETKIVFRGKGGDEDIPHISNYNEAMRLLLSDRVTSGFDVEPKVEVIHAK